MKIKEHTNISNPFSVHGIYPYRGKISAIDAEHMLAELKPKKTLLDPFCGSGTILYEAMKTQSQVIGFDTNPVASWLSSGKIELTGAISIEEYLAEAKGIISKGSSSKKVSKMPADALKHFHSTTADEIMRAIGSFEKMSDYVRACFLGAVALAARGCNNYMWTSSTVGKDINPKRYINFNDKFLYKIKKHYYPLDFKGNVDIYRQDSRKLSDFIKPKSVDYVFTSPPYFDALDYTSYYAKIIYTILGFDRKIIRESLIQTTKSYKEDMRMVLNEVVKVTHDSSLIIFVVGDKKLAGEVINGGEYFSDLLHHKPSKIIERSYSGSSSQVFDKINKTQRKEQIVIWDRSEW